MILSLLWFLPLVHTLALHSRRYIVMRMPRNLRSERSDKIIIINKQCEDENCTKWPCYNAPGEKTGRFCKEHSSPGMVDVVNKQCEDENCTKQPKYNAPGEKTGRFYKEHSPPGMVDVVKKQCEDENCTKKPCYNAPGEKTGRFCKEHSPPGMVDVVNKQCIKCNLVSAISRWNYICYKCYVRENPDTIRARNYKVKEDAVVQVIFENFPLEKFQIDKAVSINLRPDILLEKETYLVVVEVDEECHRRVNNLDERNRIQKIKASFVLKHICFIRFNPDGYLLKGKKIKSCWHKDKISGKLIIRPDKENEWKNRLQHLVIEVKNVIDELSTSKNRQMIYKDELDVIYLFYGDMD